MASNRKIGRQKPFSNNRLFYKGTDEKVQSRDKKNIINEIANGRIQRYIIKDGKKIMVASQPEKYRKRKQEADDHVDQPKKYQKTNEAVNATLEPPQACHQEKEENQFQQQLQEVQQRHEEQTQQLLALIRMCSESKRDLNSSIDDLNHYLPFAPPPHGHPSAPLHKFSIYSRTPPVPYQAPGYDPDFNPHKKNQPF